MGYCLPSPPWNLSSFTVKMALLFPCSSFDSSLFCQVATLARLDSSILQFGDLDRWLCSFSKGGSGVLANCLLCGAETNLSFLSVFPLKLVPFCKLSAGLGSNNKSAISLLLSDSRSVLTTLSSYPSFLLPQVLLHIWQELFFLSFLLSGYNGYPQTLPKMTRLRICPGGVRYSCPLQSLAVSLLFLLISTLLFSRTGDELFYLNSSTHTSSWFLLRNLCSLATLAVSSLVFAATATAFY